MLDHTKASAILTRTKPHISYYSLFGLNLRCEAILQVEARASFLGILLAEKT